MNFHPTLMSQMAADNAAGLRQSAEPRPQPRVNRPRSRRGGAGTARWALLRRQLLALGLPENDLR